MAAKRRARRPRSDDSEELGHNGGIEGFNDDDDSGEVPAEPKGMPLKRAEELSPLSPEDDDGAQGSVEASPARSAPRGGSGAALKTKKMASERVKKPPPASQEEDEAGDSTDASPARDPLPNAGHNKRAATTKRGEKRSLPPRQEEERSKKRAAGPDGETVAGSAPQRKKKTKRSTEDRRKKKKTNRSSPDIAQDDEHNGRQMAEQGQEQINTVPPQDEHRAREEEKQEKNTEQELAGDTSAPHEHDKDMHSARGEEEQEEVVNQEHADDTSPTKDNHCGDEEEQQGALQGRKDPSTKPRSSETEKKPSVELSWSYDDELKILNALVVHAQSHDGALPDSSHLLANLTFDKIDANEDKLNDKIRKLRTRYHRLLSQGCPSDDRAHRLFELSETLWGQVDEDERVEPTSRDLSVLSKLYPHLAKEVKAYAETHISRDVIIAMFMTIDDEKARDLDAKCKKQQIEAFKLELGQASLTNELLSALSSLSRVRF